MLRPSGAERKTPSSSQRCLDLSECLHVCWYVCVYLDVGVCVCVCAYLCCCTVIITVLTQDNMSKLT